MTETEEIGEAYDFLCEKRLAKTDPFLHKCYQSSVFAIDLLLSGYKNIFPYYTNHTFEHSAQVIHYCNVIAGNEIVGSLNPDEIYILLMGASLHDVGMGISEADFERFSADIPGFAAYRKEHPDDSLSEYTREFHQDFSVQFIKKYASLFEIPSKEHAHCIEEVARGHRNADLLDENEFGTAYPLPNGNTVNLAYLAALVKFADELDVTADRNLLFDYSQTNKEWSAKQTMCFRCHGAIKRLCFRNDSLILFYDTEDPLVEAEILRTRGKVEQTFREYVEVVLKRTSYTNRLMRVLFEKISQNQDRTHANV